MKRNEALDKALEQLKETGDTWASWDVLRAYKRSEERGNEVLDFEFINTDVNRIADTLKKAGITKFTVSDASTGLMMILSTMAANGAIIEGMTTVNGTWTDNNDNWVIVPAVKLSLY